MPYIVKSHRDYLKENPDKIHSVGELNYQLTQMCLAYLLVNTNELIGPSYSNYNSVIGALEACKLEFYRRMVSPYEDKKIQENGDVYT
jgi:hypothetical protein